MVGDLQVVGDVAYQLVVVDSFTAYGVNMGTHFSLTGTANTSSSVDCVGELKQRTQSSLQVQSIQPPIFHIDFLSFDIYL
ncbi:hypothetical protein WJ93_22430 [Burkholderia ubonensis]|nr:hypothetical protein WJ93_22430 [Burkholderia ubonensis]